MRGVNKVIIIGTLGADPEIKTLNNGGIVANISVATSEAWNDRQTGERKEHTEWHRVSLFNSGNYKMADIAQQYLRKGSQVYLEGSLRTRKYQDQTGQDRYITEIRVDSMQMLGGNRANGQPPMDNTYINNNGNFPQPNFNQNYQQNSNPYHQQQNMGYQPPAQHFQNNQNNQFNQPQGQYNPNQNYPQTQPFQPPMGNQFMEQNPMQPQSAVAPQMPMAQPMQPQNQPQPQPQNNVAQPPANIAQPPQPQNDIPPVAPMTGMPSVPKAGVVDDDIPF